MVVDDDLVRDSVVCDYRLNDLGILFFWCGIFR